jgi:acyl carrier protein
MGVCGCLFSYFSLIHVCPVEGSKRKTPRMNVRTEIVTQFNRVAQEQGKRLAPLTDGLELLNSGLDSLSIAILVSRLEDSLGIDPFMASEDAQFPVTFGDFVNLYEHVAK